MNATPPPVEDCVQALVKKFAVEDVWLLEAEHFPEAEFERPYQLVVVLRDGMEPHQVEREASVFIKELFPEVAVHAFAQKAMFQTPRPLLVKMAFTKGRSVYRG